MFSKGFLQIYFASLAYMSPHYPSTFILLFFYLKLNFLFINTTLCLHPNYRPNFLSKHAPEWSIWHINWSAFGFVLCSLFWSEKYRTVFFNQTLSAIRHIFLPGWRRLFRKLWEPCGPYPFLFSPWHSLVKFTVYIHYIHPNFPSIWQAGN